MCPVSRTNNSEEIPVVIPDNYYEETSAYELSKVDPDWSLKLNRNLAANCRNISDEVFPGIHLGDRWKFNMTSSNYTNNQEPTLWSTYHDIKAVLEAPAIEKRQVQVLVDDSNRIVDMTLIQPNLYIGDELVFNIPLLHGGLESAKSEHFARGGEHFVMSLWLRISSTPDRILKN